MRSRWLYLLLGSLLVGGVIFVAIYAEQITPVSPYYMDERAFITQGSPPFPPGGNHPLGTDHYGRDIWSRVAYGTRWSLLFASLIMAGRLLLALPMGIAAAFGPRFFSWLVGRLYVFTSAVPPLVVYLAVLAVPRLRTVGLWPSVAITVALLSLVEWPRVAVYVQGRLEELSGEGYVEGAVAAGATRLRIFWRHLMPHLWATLFQLVSAEIGRGLLSIAQLGIFGIWLGGGIVEMVGFNPPVPAMITGIPEWGALLSEARNTIRNTPWIPMSPAFAFLIAVVGFHLLSQGLDGFSFSLFRLREATTGRISAWWRLAVIPFLLVPVIYWWQVKTRDDRPAIVALAERQTQALKNRDLNGYLATLSPADADYIGEQRNWLGGLMQTDFKVAVAVPLRITQTGNTAIGDWRLSFGYTDRPPVTITRSVALQRSGDLWLEGRGAFERQRGFHTDVYAQFNAADGAREVADLRWQIRKIHTVMDRAFANAIKAFPALQAPPRPRVIYFRNDADYRAVIAEADQESNFAYTPGEAIRVSPAVLKPYEPEKLESALTHTMIHLLTAEGLGKETADPIAVGLWEEKASVKAGEFWFNVYRVEGRLASLPELYAVPMATLRGQEAERYNTQAALLVQFIRERIGGSGLQAGLSIADLAQLAGISEAELAAGYDNYVKERILMESMLSRPEWASQVDMGVVEAMNRRAGLTSMEANLIDIRVKEDVATVLALERYQANHGWTSAVVSQTWVRQGDTWQLKEVQ